MDQERRDQKRRQNDQKVALASSLSFTLLEAAGLSGTGDLCRFGSAISFHST